MVVGYVKEDSLTPNQKLIAGVVSGVSTRFITQPLDILKVRTQLQAKDKIKSLTWIGLFFRILKEEGIPTFWHGHSLGQMHSIISVASQFYAYEISTKFVENHATPYVSPQVKRVLLFVCGIFAGCASATLVSPIEVIRVRQMVVKAQYGGVWQGARVVYRSGGLLAFYEGLPASLMQMGPQTGITFAVFRFVQPLVMDYLTYLQYGRTDTEEHRKATVKKHLLISSTIAGSAAGFVSKTLTYPFDLAKRRLQISSHQPSPDVKTPTTSQNLVKCKTLVQCLLNMIRKDGFGGLYAGWDVSNQRATLQSVAAFTTYEMDGLPGMFTGWTITILRAQLYTVVAFTTYEMMCQLLRDFNERAQ